MEHFVTLYDSLFLPQGLALHASMERHVKKYTLWVLCVDDEAYKILEKLELSNVRLLQLSQLETAELLKVKAERTKGEYCWTLTPFAPRFVFEADSMVERVTYVDADLWFRKDPIAIFKEMESSGKSVLITEHGYSPEYDLSATSGQYCVQFMVFERVSGEPVRQWWEERCIEWCFARVENDKFGDQKYLDCWPEIFSSLVHVLSTPELTLAPWNATRYSYSSSVFYHFHGLRLLARERVDIGEIYSLPKVLIDHVYKPYLKDFRAAISLLSDMGFLVKYQKKENSIIKKVVRFIGGVVRQYWRFKAVNIIKF